MSTPTTASPHGTWWQAQRLPAGRIGLITPGIAPLKYQYSGGLEGLMMEFVSMGDHYGLPLTVFTLLYTYGYGEQSLRNGHQEMSFAEAVTPEQLGLEPVTRDGENVYIEVPLSIGVCYLRLWREHRGTINIIYMQADNDRNSAEMRALGYYLYGGKPQSTERLRQQLLLGFGSVLAAEATDHIEAWHNNDPHGALAALLRLQHYVTQDNLDWDSALRLVRATSLVTTHTPVPDGIDRYPWQIVMDELVPWSKEFNDASQLMQEVIDLGTFPGESGLLNMLALSVRTSKYVNGVSWRHGLESSALLQPLFPSCTIDEVPVVGITNGIDPRTWVHPMLAQMFERYLGPDWFTSDPDIHRRIADVPRADLWRTINQVIEQNVALIRQRLEQQSRAVGWAHDDLDWTYHALEPNDDGTYPLIIGFARRMTGYKRGNWVKQVEDRLAGLIQNGERRICILIAGKAHPDDLTGQGYIADILSVAQRLDLRANLVYLANYSVDIARLLVQSVHVWMNNPIPPLEASGTSGEKAVWNLAWTLSVRDGWVYDFGTYDTISTISMSAASGDRFANAMLDVLERDIIPAFYERDEQGIPQRWLDMIIRSFEHLAPRVSAARMMQQYAELFYGPMLAQGGSLRQDLKFRVGASA
jgi:starch phosphorylase